MDNPALRIIRTVSAGIGLFIHKATAFHGTPGCPEIPLAIIISQLAAFAGTVIQRGTCGAVCTATADACDFGCYGVTGI